ncbi:hypothetical protein BS50DRAFT_503989 [Corynespora cassiicola Philippines]|uniref:Carboxymuconolactone decarboxylase-like domain-containing protein n=1 Tax=Corynespora cassiicola Philippines TaxID=1448308 RepID=A0A2T2N929_CORCC|nr:hypothetical protein BS50DRAFT_503989 [Corynespora cassiicola Philippines]
MDRPALRPDLVKLFESISQKFNTTSLGPDRWYILTLSALVGGTEPEFADQLYLYLCTLPEFQTPTQRQSLVRRLRETLVKLVSIVGVCKPLEAIIAIMKVERPEDRDYSFSRRDWKNDDENHARAMGWMTKIYERNLESTLDMFAAHQDFRWISTEITYGLYLSDRKELDDWDTELVVLVGIMVQNLRLETHWHIRGARRIGFEQKDVKTVVECVREIGEMMGCRLDRIPKVEEVEGDI